MACDTIKIETLDADEVVSIVTAGPQGPSGAEAATLTTQGDTLYRGPTAPQRLGIGAPGQVLKVNSGATAPEWANESGAVTQVNGQTGAVTLTASDVGAAPATGISPSAITGTAVVDSDPRLTDARTPSSTLAHKTSHATGGSDALSAADIGAAAASHTHTATAISDSTTAGRALLTAADAAAQRTSLGLGTASVEAASAFAQASHTHGNLTNDGKVGSTSGLPVVTTTSGAITTLALGSAGQVLKVNSGGTAVEFGAVASGDTVSITSSASDVLSVSSGAISGVDANADRIVYWNNTSNKLAYGVASDVGAAAASHTHAASDVTSGTFDNARINFAEPAAIGGTTPSTGAFTSLTTAPAANTSALTSTGYSLTGSNAQSLIDLAGTWNTTGAPVGIKLNLTNTASGTSARLVDFQVGGASRFSINASGRVFLGQSGNFVGGIDFAGGAGITQGSGDLEFTARNNKCLYINGNNLGCLVGPSGLFGFTDNANVGQGATDVFLTRDAAGILAQRNGTNAQEKRLYGTFTSSTNYQRMTIKSVRQTLSALNGASATTTGTFIPDGAVVVGVTTRVATALTGATGYTIGDGTDADRWGDITGTAIGTTSDNRDWTAGTIECFTAGGNITLTAKTANFTAGAIEICVFYLAGEAD